MFKWSMNQNPWQQRPLSLSQKLCIRQLKFILKPLINFRLWHFKFRLQVCWVSVRWPKFLGKKGFQIKFSHFNKLANCILSLFIPILPMWNLGLPLFHPYFTHISHIPSTYFNHILLYSVSTVSQKLRGQCKNLLCRPCL